MKPLKFISLFSIISILFFSCKNFMNGDSFLQELQKLIDYENSPSYDVHINSQPGTGTYKKGGGDNKFKVGDEIQIEYVLQTGYQFLGWTVTSETGTDLKENVSFTPEKSLSTTVEFLKEGNLNITPNCAFNPGISEYEPKYNWLGVTCDTPIVITFNILIDETTLTKENIHIKNKNDLSLDYSDYFTFVIEKDPELNVTILTLKPDSSISELFINDHEQIDITISLQKENISIKANSDIHLMGETSWYYRINSGRETALPIIKEVSFYNKGPDSEGKFDEQNKLTSKDFEEWTREDCFTNHVKDLYIYIKGYDADSGLDYVRIKGDLIKSANGEDAKVDGFENRLGKKDDFKTTKEPDADGNYFKEYYTKIDFTHQFADSVLKNNLILNDGLVKYDIYLVDRAGNKSEAQTLYFIKDTTVTTNRIRSNAVASYIENGKEIMLDNISSWERTAVNGIDTVNLYFTSITSTGEEMLDPFFKFDDEELTDTMKITDLKWGYDLNLKEPITPNVNPCPETDGYPDGAYYTIKRDENRETYIKITAQDGAGNTNSRIIAIPEKNRIIKIEKDTSYESYRIYFSNFQENCTLKPTESSVDCKFGTVDNKWNDYVSIRPDNRNQIPFFTDVYYNQTIQNDGVDLGLPYYLYALNNYTFDNWSIIGTASGNIKITADSELVDDKYIPKKIAKVTNGKINRNEGLITLITSYSDYEKNNNYECFVGYKATDKTDYSYSASNEFSVQTGHKYELKPFVYKDGHYIANSAAEIVTVDFTASNFDNKSPEFSFEPLLLHEYNSPLPNYVELYPFKDSTGILQANGSYEIEYWFIPNPTASSSAISCTEDYLYSYKSNPNVLKIKTSEYPQLVYDNNNTVDPIKSGRIQIPLDDLPEFSYTLFVKVTDSSDLKNYSIYSNYANNILVRDDDFDFEYDKTKDYYSITFKNGPKPEQYFTIYPWFQIFNNNTGKWEKNLITNPLDYQNENRIYISQTCYYLAKNEQIGSDYASGDYTTDLYSDCSGKYMRISAFQGYYDSDNIDGYYKTKYVYPDYYRLKDSGTPMVFKNKGFQKLNNGVQIFTDNAVLVHTFYCSSNLGDDDDMWINHGIETGVVMENSNFTYLDDNLKEIPVGKFYKTFIHFADGTIYSTDIAIRK